MVRPLAYLSIIAALLFLIAVVVLLFLAPGVDPMRFGISFYALAGYGPTLGIAVALAGVSGISLAAALWGATISAAGRIGLVLLVAWGISCILAGIFPLDAPGSTPTLPGTIHNTAGLNFLLIAAAALLIELTRSTPASATGGRPGTYWFAWAVLAAAILLFVFNGPLASLGIGGLMQRLYWLVLVVWLMLKARQVLRGGSPAVRPVAAT